MKTTRTSSRKQQHIHVTLTKDVGFKAKTAGFERWEFQHNALPELNLSEIETATTFLGKRLSFPFIISSMTGGYAEAERINRQLAEVCAAQQLALGVGSQRQAIEDSRYHRSFSIVRNVSKDIPVFGNIGAAEVARLKNAEPILRLIDLIAADGFAVHLNPLQEFLQPEGDTNFRGVLAGIEMLVKVLPVPVLVKEIGAGISLDVAQRLVNVGVSIIDIAGAGGTSWAGVEILRRKKERGTQYLLDGFWDWGIPTVDALQSVCQLKKASPMLKVIASGGIASGSEIAKSIAFGADITGSARPILQVLAAGGIKAVVQMLEQWKKELQGTMFLTGSRTLCELQQQKMLQRQYMYES